MEPRLNAFREDLADERLRPHVTALSYAAGREAVVTTGLAPVRRAASPDAPLDTFFRFGEPMLVFDAGGEFAWCQSQFDSYVGYVERAHIIIGPAPSPTHFVATMGSYRYAEPDLRSSAIDFLPRHSAVTVAELGLVTRGTEYAGLTCGGFLPLACLSPEPPRSADTVAAAERYLGCPYLWGGVCFLGIDCSALVQNAFRDLGIIVLRDTDMQRDSIGEAIAVTEIDDLREGDLIYIPGHVMLYAGKGAVIHADGGTMMVRRDELTTLMRSRGWSFTGFAARRPASLAG